MPEHLQPNPFVRLDNTELPKFISSGRIHAPLLLEVDHDGKIIWLSDYASLALQLEVGTSLRNNESRIGDCFRQYNELGEDAPSQWDCLLPPDAIKGFDLNLPLSIYAIGGSPARILITIANPIVETVHRQLHQDLIDNKNKLQTMIENFGDAVVSINDRSEIIQWNRAAEAMFGLSSEHAVGTRFERFVPHELRAQAVDEPVWFHPGLKNIRLGDDHPAEVEVLTSDGQRRSVLIKLSSWKQYGERFVTAAITDITEQKTLRRLVRSDTLTSALTRTALSRDFADGVRSRDHFLLILDIDYFKSINDNYGHSVGDEFLRAFAGNLQTRLPTDGRIFRLGGDEFAVIGEVPEVASSDPNIALGEFAAHIQELASRARLEHQNRVISRTVSLGATHLRLKDKLSEALTLADDGLQRAKRMGRNTWQLSDSTLTKSIIKRLSRPTPEEVAVGIHRNEFDYFLQPVRDHRTDQIEGFEALLRWTRIERVLTPELFLDEYYVATRRLKNHYRLTLLRSKLESLSESVPGWISFNVRVEDLSEDGHHDIIRILGELTARRRIIIEISEEALSERSHDAMVRTALSDLREAGFYIALDDFGTESSNLNRLLNWPIDVLKIDRLFVTKIHDSGTQRIVAALVSLASSFGIKTLAEGVERDEQKTLLARLGVTSHQGYLFSKPRPIIDINRDYLSASA